jgi:hypothetical protein
VRCSRFSNFRVGFWSSRQIEGVLNRTHRMGIRILLHSEAGRKGGRSATLPLRSDDAGHRVEETIESYFRLVEG